MTTRHTRLLAGGLIAFLLVATPLTAQQLLLSLDLSSFGWGAVSVDPVDTDRNPLTHEWAVRSPETNRWRVVAERPVPGGLCIGPWFLPAGSDQPFTGTRIVRRGGVDVIESARFTVRWYTSLDTPSC